jgi:hypothetical protein
MTLQEAELMNYQDLKLITSKELENCDRLNHESWLSKVWQKIVAALTEQNTQGFRVWNKTDRRGNTYWQVRDSATNQTITFNSEAEVRVWIEESYYRPAVKARSFKPYAWQVIER